VEHFVAKQESARLLFRLAYSLSTDI